MGQSLALRSLKQERQPPFHQTVDQRIPRQAQSRIHSKQQLEQMRRRKGLLERWEQEH
jgi:hypothetical protein